VYRLFFKLVLARVDPERAHALAAWTLSTVRATRIGRATVARLAGATDERLRVRALGLTFPSPLGVAAGVDKEAAWFDDLGALGFGFVEVGTVTARRQHGNDHPRVARLIGDRALVNRMGFPNPGAQAVAGRLQRRPGGTVVGVNIGKSADAPVESAGDDYRASVRQIAELTDYIVLNVSSPNTPRLREMQAVALLGPLVGAVRSELESAKEHVPLLVKIGPDLDDGELDAVSSLAVELALDGIVAVNTTVDRRGLTDLTPSVAPFDGGGISGGPLRARALDVLRRLRANVGDSLVLISVGGIATADDAWERIGAGATLVQAYSGFIYGGPAWPRDMNRALARRVGSAGYASIQDHVGAASASPQAFAPPNENGAGSPSDQAVPLSGNSW